MPLNASSLFENLWPASKPAETQTAPAGRVFGTRPEARPSGLSRGTGRADFASFLKAESRAEAGAAEETVLEDRSAASDWPEDLREAATWPEFESGLPAPGDEALASGLGEGDFSWPLESAFQARLEISGLATEVATEVAAPAAVPVVGSELPDYLLARAAAAIARPEMKPGDFAARTEVRFDRAAETGHISEEPPVQATPRFGTVSGFMAAQDSQSLAAPVFSDVARSDSALTSGFEKYEAPAPAPTAPPSAGGDDDGTEALAPWLDKPGVLGAPRSEAETAGSARSPRPGSALTSGFEKYEFEAPAAARPGPALTVGSAKFEVPAAHAPAAHAPAAPAPTASLRPAPTVAPSAGGDEDGAETGLGLARSARPELSLSAGAVKFEAPTARPTAPPSAGDEDAAEAGPALSRSFRPGPAFTVDSGKYEAPTAPRPGSALSADSEKYEVPTAPPTAPPRLATLVPGRNGRPVPGDWNSLTSGILARKHLNLASGQLAAPPLGRGDAAERTALTEALDRARISWPAPFRKQVGLGLVALGRPGLSANSMTAGAALLGSSSPGEVLRSVLSSLKGELKVLKLPPRARDDLGRILAGSGLDQARLGRIMAGFGRDGLSLADLDKQLAGLDLSGRGQGLIATEAGLTELGRFLGSLGASAEVIDQALNSIKPGQPVTGEVLRDIFRHTEVGGLARNLGPGDIKSLAAFLREMGAGPQTLDKLENQLWQSSGQMPLESFLDFLDGLKESPTEAVSGQEMEAVKSLLDQVSREDGLARAPIFNEILIKLRALGDSELDDDFMNFSPALQALRGGISGSEDFISGQFKGQDRGRENQERYRQVIHAMSTGQDGPAGASVMAEAEGYGGRSETMTRQIAQKIILSRRRGLHRLKMNLHPADLGRLDIELSVKDGALTASIKAENRAAYEALGERVAELKKALAEGGVELAGLTLAHDDAESGRTITLGLAELAAEKKAARARAAERPGEVHYMV